MFTGKDATASPESDGVELFLAAIGEQLVVGESEANREVRRGVGDYLRQVLVIVSAHPSPAIAADQARRRPHE